MSCLSLCIYFLVDVLHYICLQDRQLVYFYAFVNLKKKKKKKKKCGNMGKNIKSYAIVPTLHSPGKGWKPHGKKVSVHQLKQKNGLTIHSWVLPSSKFTGKILLFKKLFFFW